MTSRRDFLSRAASGSAMLLVAGRMAPAQEQRPMVHDTAAMKDSTNLFAMDQSAALPVRLPPKPNAKPSMTDRERDDVEHRIHCQCGCTLSVFICRTTDFSCQVSPAMHRDVMALVQGGYSAQEIIDAFVNVYGQRALMAPKKSGFDLIAWVMPGTALIAGGVALAFMLRTWGARSRAHAAMPASRFVATRGDSDATPEELAALEAAVRAEDRT